MIKRSFLRASLVIPIVHLLPSCATISNTPPSSYSAVSLSEEVPLSKEVAWRNVIHNLAENFFVINNIDEKVGLINVSYSGEPGRFIDCGRHQFHNLTNNFDFAITDNSYPIPGVSRHVTLEGRANLLLTSIGENRTEVTVHVRYVFTENVFAANATASVGTATFDSNQIGHLGAGTAYCRPTGDLERAFLRTPYTKT